MCDTAGGEWPSENEAQPAIAHLLGVVPTFLVAVLIAIMQPLPVLSQSEQSLLYDFYTSTGGWYTWCSVGWSTNSAPLCSGSNTTWYGVTCSAGRVTQISLYACGIYGTLPPLWSSLTNIQTLALFVNSLSGTLPPQWGSMTGMQALYLASNILSGPLPTQWSSMTALKTLHLWSNSLSGTLPPQWSSMTNIQVIDLDTNSLSGTLPPQWNGMSNVYSLDLRWNSLSGTLPPQWSSMTNLQSLYLSHNSLSGTLPPQWSNLISMQTLFAYTNSLSGTLPPQWSGISNLTFLDLGNNSLIGTLPPQWSSLSNMQTLYLDVNTLSGTLPPQWSSLANMILLYLNNNSICGTLPLEWSVLRSSLSCFVNGNRLNTSNAASWWLNSSYRNITAQQSVECVAFVARGASRGASLTLSSSRSKWNSSIPPSSVNPNASVVTRTPPANRRPPARRSSSMSISSSGVPFCASATLRRTTGYLALSTSFSVSPFSVSATLRRTTGYLTLSTSFSVSSFSVSAATLRRGATNSKSFDSNILSCSPSELTVATRSSHAIPSVSRSASGFRSADSATMPHTSSQSIPKSTSSSPSSETRSLREQTYSPTTSFAPDRSRTDQVLGTMSLTPLCDTPPLSIYSSLRVAQVNNESLCREHLCPTASASLIDGVRGVTLTVAYDAMMVATSVLLTFLEGGIPRQWLSLPPLVTLGTVLLDVSTDDVVGLVMLRPSTGWPGLDVRPYTVQRISLLVALRCRSANATVVSHPTQMILVVAPRTMPAAASVLAVVQSSQGISGGLGSGGGADALTMGRLAMSLSMLACNDALQGFGVGQGVISVSGDLLAAVDTIAGNVVFVAGVAAASVLVSCALYIFVSSSCSWMTCCRDVMCLPLSLFPAFAATLPSTVMAVVTVLRDAPTLSGGAASGAFGSIAIAAAVWGTALVMVGSTVRRMALAATLRPTRSAVPDAAAVTGCGIGAVVLMFRWALQPSTEWVSPQPADALLFEGTTVLWLLPLDIGTSVLVAVVSALPLSRSAALCIGANAVNVVASAVMLVVAAVRRPFATAFGRVHSVVTYVLALALTVCGLVLVTTNDDERSMMLVISYLSGSAAVLSASKAVVDAVGIVAATRRRLGALTNSSCVCKEHRYNDDKDNDHLTALPVGDVVLECDIEALQPEANTASDEDSVIADPPLSMLLGHNEEGLRTRMSAPFVDLLGAYEVFTLPDF